MLASIVKESVKAPTHQSVAEELVRLNLVQRRLEENAILTKLIVIIVINSATELLGLVVKEFKICVALLLGLGGLFLDSRLLLLGLPLGLVLVPLIVVVVISIVVREVRVVTQSLLAV